MQLTHTHTWPDTGKGWSEHEHIQMSVSALTNQNQNKTLSISHTLITVLATTHHEIKNILYRYDMNRISSEFIPGKNPNLNSFKFKLTEGRNTKQPPLGMWFCCYQTGDAL